MTLIPKDYLIQNGSAKKLSQKYFAALAALAGDFKNFDGVDGLLYLQRAPQKFGYDGAVYFHKASAALVFVNRGAEGAKSIEDWFQGGAAAITSRFNGPLAASVTFAIDTIAKLSKAPGLAGVKMNQVAEIFCTGHSWGGALSEAQVALTTAIAAKGGVTVVQPMSGIGFASAGFADALKAYAQAEGVALEDDMHWLMNHFIRGMDPILLQPNHEVLGEYYAIPSIYAASPTPAANGRGFEQGLAAPILENHDATLYFQHFELRGGKHLFRKKDRSFLLCEGIVPPKTRFGTVKPESVIVGVPL